MLDNARKYSDPGQGIDVTLKCVAPEAGAVSVRNIGAEIPASDLPFVFNRFYRGHQPDARYHDRERPRSADCQMDRRYLWWPGRTHQRATPETIVTLHLPLIV